MNIIERPLIDPLWGFQIYFPSQTIGLRLTSNDNQPTELLLQLAGMGGIHPTRQPVGNVAGIAQGTAATAEITARVDASAVISPGCAVEARDIRVGLGGEELLEAVA